MSSAFRDAHQHFLIFVFVFFVSLNIYSTAWSIVLLLSFVVVVVVVVVVVTGMYQFGGDFFFKYTNTSTNTFLFSTTYFASSLSLLRFLNELHLDHRQYEAFARRRIIELTVNLDSRLHRQRVGCTYQ